MIEFVNNGQFLDLFGYFSNNFKNSFFLVALQVYSLEYELFSPLFSYNYGKIIDSIKITRYFNPKKQILYFSLKILRICLKILHVKKENGKWKKGGKCVLHKRFLESMLLLKIRQL